MYEKLSTLQLQEIDSFIENIQNIYDSTESSEEEIENCRDILPFCIMTNIQNQELETDYTQSQVIPHAIVQFYILFFQFEIQIKNQELMSEKEIKDLRLIYEDKIFSNDFIENLFPFLFMKDLSGSFKEKEETYLQKDLVKAFKILYHQNQDKLTKFINSIKLKRENGLTIEFIEEWRWVADTLQSIVNYNNCEE